MGSSKGKSKPEAVPKVAPRVEQVAADRLRTRITRQDAQIFEMRTLLESSKGLFNILKLGPLLSACMAVARERYGFRKSAVLLKDDLDPSRTLYVMRSFHNLDPVFTGPNGEEPLLAFKFPEDDGLLWHIVSQGRVFSFLDLQGRPRFEHATIKWNLGILEADLWVPLIKSGEVLGVLTLGDPVEPTILETDDFSFLQEFAAIATNCVDSTLKYEKNERILRNIQTLYDVNQQLSNVNDFKRLCKETLAKAIDAVGAQKGNLMLLNPETGLLEIRVVWGLIPEHVRDGINNGTIDTKAVAVGEGIAGRAAQMREAIRVNNKDEIPDLSKFQVHCMCSVPVIDGERVQGVINVTNKVKAGEDGAMVIDPLGRFTEEDLNLLRGLADQAATGLKKAKLYSDSITDRLTDLHNTRHFEECLASEFAKSLKTESPLCLAVTDIDHFKKFNDTYGHKAGDAVLKEIATLFSRARRTDSEDMTFRYGGEEFCMLLPDTTPDEAALILENFRQTVEDHTVNYEGQELKVTVSIGIACSLLDTKDQKDLFRLADECLYVCKEGGRNQVRVELGGARLKADKKGFDKSVMQVYLKPLNKAS